MTDKENTKVGTTMIYCVYCDTVEQFSKYIFDESETLYVCDKCGNELNRLGTLFCNKT